MQDKKVSLRMCIVCKNMLPKRELIRIVKDDKGEYHVDKTSKANGRGAYVCDKQECIDKLVKSRALSRSFKENLPMEVYDKILEEYANYKN